MASVPSLQFRKITFTSCCDENDILEFKYTSGNYGPLVYPNPAYLPGLSAVGFKNTCYTVQISLTDLNDWSLLPNISSYPPTFFNKVQEKEAKCSDYIFPNFCPECNPQCYTLYNCEGQSFNSTNDLEVYASSGQPITIYNEAGVIPGTWYVYINDGPCPDINNEFAVEDVAPPPCDCRCFQVIGATTIKYIDCEGNIQNTLGNTKFCSLIDPIVTGNVNTTQVAEVGLCVDGECPEICYELTNCETKEVIYSTLQSLFQYIGKIVRLAGYEGCWEVDTSTSADCECITVTIEDRSGVNEYTASLITPYNGWNRWTFTIGTDNYFIWNLSVNPASNWTISKDSSGPIPGTSYAQSKLDRECPEAISDGTLTGWVIQPEIPWINVQTERCPGPCECPVDITVLESFDKCEDCLPVIAYKLQNCEKIYEVQYTTQDLSEYVGQVIETDCGCWTVTQIDVLPPSITLVVIDNVFKTCNECLSTYYRLVDCAGEVGDIVTKTNLSEYLGQVIKIENCDTCWEVFETRTFTELSNVVVVTSYKDCKECGIDLPCVCSKITNITSTEQTIYYIDCEDGTEEIKLLPGETSEKICLKKWILDTPQPLPPNELLYPEYFGNCQNGVCPPPIFKNNRTVRPGYNTPICTPAKYDEITCKFADILYKIALEKRYGITNCCPDEDDKWLIKKELIDLQALKDPNYNCSECSCSCDSVNTGSTCNCKN